MMQRGVVNVYNRLVIDILERQYIMVKTWEGPPRVVYRRCYDYVS
jgi:hypothetical protein